MKIIYGVCAWGLGHSTRSLPIIKGLVKENNDIRIISSGRALELLRSELGESCEYEDVPDYPAPKKTDKAGVFIEGLAYIPLYINTIRKEMNALHRILRKHKCDMIVSDNRYGLYIKGKPSFLITHQLRIMNPFRLRFLERGTETYNRFFLKDGRRSRVLVPDFENDGLSGDLSHNLSKIDEKKIDYIGPVSDFHRSDVVKDIDVFFSISGPEPHRTSLENSVLDQLDSMKGNVIVSLGKTDEKKSTEKHGVKIYSSLPSLERASMLSRSKLVVSRSGYSTLMDIAAIGTKAMFIPTPEQPEQEYLARYHKEKEHYYSVSQQKMNISSDIKNAMDYNGYSKSVNSSKTVENAMRILLSSERKEF